MIDRPVGIVQSTGEVIYGRATDISLSGMSIKCDYTADAGQQFDLFLNLPADDRVRRMEARAKVIYVHFIGGENRYRLGMQFTKFLGSSREYLSSFLSDRLR